MKRSTRANLVLYGIAFIILVTDQATKYWVRQTIPLYSSAMPIAWLKPFVRLTHVFNPGAAFGLGKEWGSIFVFTAFLAIVLIVAYFRRLAAGAPLLRAALGLQLGGAFGNLIDRLRFGGVTDFIDLGWFPVFNVADSAITIGTILLAYYAIFIDKPPREASPARAQEASQESHSSGDQEV